ncbi:MAG: M43 family zinc metalloprotease [Bacteroidota bacterium]
MEQRLQSMYPGYQTMEEFEEILQRKMAESSGSRSIYTIPLIIHIVHDGEPVGVGRNISQAQVESQVEVLNEDFRRKQGTLGFNSNAVGADVEIEFCLAQVDPDGNPLVEAGIERIDRSSFGFRAPPYTVEYCQDSMMLRLFWDPTRYMNMYTFDLANDFLGFAKLPRMSTVPGLPNDPLPDHLDGVGITYSSFGRVGNVNPPYNLGRTATHEVGHYLGLNHIWGDGGCSQDDGCSDTPDSNSPNFDCNSPNPPVKCGSSDMYENYMDYSDDECMNIFTQCQKQRMRTVMDNALRRASLLNSTVCQAPTGPNANFTASNLIACEGSEVQFFPENDVAGNSYLWSFTGGTPASSTQKNPIITYNTPGVFEVSLRVVNGGDTSTVTLNDYVTVTSSSSQEFYVFDFENGFEDWTVDNPDDEDTWEIIGVVGSNNGQFAATLPYYSYSFTGELDYLISPNFDFGDYYNIKLSFEYAYRELFANVPDSLLVLASVDNGQTFPIRLYADGSGAGSTFATNSPQSNSFDPSSDEDWCYAGTGFASCPEIDLSALNGESNVRIALVGYNGFGNNIFIDNIRMEGECQPDFVSVTPEEVSEIRLFPNPTRGQLSLDLNEHSKIEIEIWNIMGQRLWSVTSLPIDNLGLHQIDVSHLNRGNYLLRIKGEDNTWVKKFTRL